MKMPALSPDFIKEITEIVFGIPNNDPKPCDVIFIFGGSHPGLWQNAAQAYFAGLGRAIVATGGYNPTAHKHPTWTEAIKTPESHVIKKHLIQLGVPESIIYCEDRSTNSLENVIFAKNVFDFSTMTTVLLVCKCYGVGRQSRTFTKNIGRPIEVIPYSFDTTIAAHSFLVTREDWMHEEDGKLFVFTEAVKIYEYGKKGDLEPIKNISKGLELLLSRSASIA